MMTRIAIAVLALAAFGFAHDEAKGKPVTIPGTVMDTGCYMSHDAIGEKHTDCATMCAKNGVPLAIVDAAGKVYMPMAKDRRELALAESKLQMPGG